MNTLLIILLVLAMAATAYVLVRGVMAMASGKDISGEQQQNVMRKRVLFQAVAIVLVILILVVAGDAALGRRDGQAQQDLHPHRRRRQRRAWSTASRISKDRARAWRRSAMSTRPIARSASRSRRSATARPCDAPARRIQNDLFDLGADLATPGEIDGRAAHRRRPGRAARARDRRDERRPRAADQLHPAGRLAGGRRAPPRPRPIARRAERAVVALHERGRSTRSLLAYLNRLSDHLFVAARHRRGERRRRRPVATRRNPLIAAAMALARAAWRDPAADARPRRAAVATPTPHPALPRRLAGQMAPGAHQLVLRDLRAARPCRPATGRSTSASASCSTAITKARASGTRGRSAGCSAARASTRSAPIARHVDEALDRAFPSLPPAALELVELGINHEQQHQELLLTDILATFAENPLEPAYGELPAAACFAAEPLSLPPRPRRDRRDRRRRRRLRLRLRAAAPPRLARTPTRSPAARSPTANGASSSPTAAIDARPVAVRRLGLGPARERRRAALLARRRQPTSRSAGGARSTAPRRSRTSATSRPTPSRAGPARGFRPRPNGRISPPPPTP